MSLRFLSVCSGIEAASVAWKPLGWQPVGFSEIEKFPAAVLSHHYPDVPNFGDMTKFEEWPDDLAPDVLVGGTPCQSFSVAGLRKGLDDPRGNLMLTFGAIAAKYRPEWLVWENVPGVLSSNGGRDFGTFLGMLAELGYGFAYRVLDAQYFGVAQQRRRVFVVANARDWRRAAAVLFERHSLSGHPAPSREAGQVAPTIPSRSTGGGGLGTDFDCDGGLIREWPAEVACTLNAAFGSKQGLEDQHALGGGGCSSLPSVSACLTTGTGMRFDPETETLIPTIGGGFDVAHTLRGEGFDASEDGTGRGTPLVPVAFDTTQITSAANYSSSKPGDPCHPLAAGAHAPAVAFNWQGGGVQTNLGYDPDSGITGSLHVGQTPAVALALRGRDGGATAEVGGDCAFTLRASEGGGDKPHVMTGMAVRRLTPRECERLQGFPDDFTAIPWRGKPARECPDGPRYKALGNSMAVPVMSWIGRRIALVDSIVHMQEAA